MKIEKYDSVTEGLVDLREQTLTFKENIQARLKDKELFNDWLDSCTGIAYKKNSTKFKLIPRCKELLEIDKDFNNSFLSVNYSKIKGTEFDSKKGKYNDLLTKSEVLRHPAWLKLLGKDLLKKYVNVVFKDRSKAMDFWIVNKPEKNQLRALYVVNLDNDSDADSNYNLNTSGSFLRVAQEDAKHDIVEINEMLSHFKEELDIIDTARKNLKEMINFFEKRLKEE